MSYQLWLSNFPLCVTCSKLGIFFLPVLLKNFNNKTKLEKTEKKEAWILRVYVLEYLENLEKIFRKSV